MGNKLTAFTQSVEGIPSSWILVIFECLSFEDRFHMMHVSKAFYRMTKSKEFYRFLISLLSKENGIYAPLHMIDKSNWMQKFKDFYQMRHLWIPSSTQPDRLTNPSNQRFKINVYAKFRPAVHTKAEAAKNTAVVLPRNHQPAEQEEEDVAEVTLPLHQRLAMIKMSHNIQNNYHALRILASEGEWFGAKWSALASAKTKSLLDIENINESARNGRNPTIGGIKAEKLVAKGKIMRSPKPYDMLMMTFSWL
jgi:hypothetical protein